MAAAPRRRFALNTTGSGRNQPGLDGRGQARGRWPPV